MDKKEKSDGFKSNNIKDFDAVKAYVKKESEAQNIGAVLSAYKKIKSIKACDKAIEINPKDIDAWNSKGLALIAIEYYEGAIKAYDEAIEINPKHADAWNNKGLALSAIENYEGAIKAYDEAIEIK